MDKDYTEIFLAGHEKERVYRYWTKDPRAPMIRHDETKVMLSGKPGAYYVYTSNNYFQTLGPFKNLGYAMRRARILFVTLQLTQGATR